MTDMPPDAECLLSERQRLVAELAKVDLALATIRPPQVGDADLIPIGVASDRALRSTQTIRRWCAHFGIGVLVAGRWQISNRRLSSILKAQRIGWAVAQSKPVTVVRDHDQ